MTVAKVIPVDLTMHMGLNQHPPVGQLLGTSHFKSHRRTPSYDPNVVRAATLLHHHLSPTSQLDSAGKSNTLKRKKRVVFADAKGLALTDVRIFVVDPPEPTPEDVAPPPPATMKDPMDEQTEQTRTLRLWLGFPQPVADFPTFVKGLAEGFVRLESCSLAGAMLSGTVRVCNISFEKVVHIRVTFDSWMSHQDVACSHVPQQFGESEMEQFAFSMPLPSNLSLENPVEFCVSFQAGNSNKVLWDNNGGQNYRLLAEVVNPNKVLLVRNRPIMTQSLQRLQAWPKRKSHVVHYPACLNPLNSPENLIKMTMTRRQNIVPLC